MNRSPRGSRVVRVAIIGAGGIVRAMHGPVLRDLARRDRRLQLIAICDLDARRAAAAAADFGFARAHTDAARMLDVEHPDAVWVAVPPGATASVAPLPLGRGIATLVEKPPGKTPAELEALIRAARRGRAPHMVAFNRRHMPLVAACRERLAFLRRAAAPLVIRAAIHRVGRHEPDFSMTAIHLLDTLVFLAGSPFAEATLRRAARTRRHPADSAVISGRLQDGSLFSVEVAPDCGQVMERLAFHLPGASLEARLPVPGGADGAGLLREWRGGRIVRELPGRRAAGSSRPCDQLGFRDMACAFIEAVRRRSKPRDPLESARSSVALADALHRGRPSWKAR